MIDDNGLEMYEIMNEVPQPYDVKIFISKKE